MNDPLSQLEGADYAQPLALPQLKIFVITPLNSNRLSISFSVLLAFLSLQILEKLKPPHPPSLLMGPLDQEHVRQRILRLGRNQKKNPLNLELFTTVYVSNKVKVNLLIGLIDVPYIHKSIPVYLSNLYLADASTFFCWWLLMIWVSHQMNGSYKSLVKKIGLVT